MKKKLLVALIIFLLLVIFKYVFSNYSFSYIVNNYKVTSVLKNGRIYFEINDRYNFDIYTNSKKKIVINKIDTINVDNYECIIPSIKGYNTYPLCYDNNDNINVDYYLIDNEELNVYKKNTVIEDKTDKDYTYYKNIDNNIFIALWTYKGYIIMNSDGYKNVTIFNKDRYDNDLAYQIDNKIYMPNYDMEHEFNEIIEFNIVNGKTNKITITKKIDYDSYIVGNIKKKLYIYDNKKSNLYEINLKNGKIKVVGSSEKGYVKLVDGKFVSCSKNEYKVDRITFENRVESNYSYSYNEGTFKTYKESKEIIEKIFNEEVEIITEDNDNVYYKYKDCFYIYSPLKGSNKIFYDYELSFNNSKSIFVYID